MRFLTFVKEYVLEHPEITFKEAVKSEEVKCLFHKAGKATHCKDSEEKVVVNINNCCPADDIESPRPSKKPTPKSIEKSYTAPVSAGDPRAYAPVQSAPVAVPMPVSAPVSNAVTVPKKMEKLLQSLHDRLVEIQEEDDKAEDELGAIGREIADIQTMLQSGQNVEERNILSEFEKYKATDNPLRQKQKRVRVKEEAPRSVVSDESKVDADAATDAFVTPAASVAETFKTAIPGDVLSTGSGVVPKRPKLKRSTNKISGGLLLRELDGADLRKKMAGEKLLEAMRLILD